MRSKSINGNRLTHNEDTAPLARTQSAVSLSNLFHEYRRSRGRYEQHSTHSLAC